MKIDLYLIVSKQTSVRTPKLYEIQEKLEKNNDVKDTLVDANEPEDITPQKIRETIARSNGEVFFPVRLRCAA
jgi:hypothetical protein